MHAHWCKDNQKEKKKKTSNYGQTVQFIGKKKRKKKIKRQIMRKLFSLLVKKKTKKKKKTSNYAQTVQFIGKNKT